MKLKINNIVRYVVLPLIIVALLSIPSYILLKGFLPSLTPNTTNTTSNNTSDTSNPAPTKTREEEILSKMSVEEKVGQLFIFGFDGTTINEGNKQFLKDCHLGGVLLLGKNISNENQLKLLIQDLQTINSVPLFISIDQEGGIVARLKWNDTLTKAQSEIATPQQSYTVAKARGEILRNLGININFAPVVEYITDKNSFMYDRVYRGTKEEVAQKGISAVKGYSDSGIISVLKHYPGHSNLSPDSHYSLPMVNITRTQWDTYIEPFSKILIGTTVDAIMVGHIEFPNIDSKPATLSYEIISNRLIKALSYNGLVITDDMEMGALDNIGTPPDIAKQSLLAGADILIYSKYSINDPTIQKDVYQHIVQEVKNGKINIDDKVLKILKIKLKYGILK